MQDPHLPRAGSCRHVAAAPLLGQYNWLWAGCKPPSEIWLAEQFTRLLVEVVRKVLAQSALKPAPETACKGGALVAWFGPAARD